MEFYITIFMCFNEMLFGTQGCQISVYCWNLSTHVAR
jgi:hypothetical protein